MNDVLIIGAGAAGCACAIEAARRGRRVVLLDERDIPGKKLLVTGNGRCNLANSDQELSHFHSDRKDLVEEVLSLFPLSDYFSWWQKLGLGLTEKNGYWYPLSNQAATVRHILDQALKKLSVEVRCLTRVRSIKEEGKTVRVVTDQGTWEAGRLALCTGGRAGFKKDYQDSTVLFQSLKLPYKPFKPALLRLCGKDPLFSMANGVRVVGKVSLPGIKSDELSAVEDTGELVISETGLGGIPVFQISGAVSASKAPQKLLCDFLPQFTKEELDSWLMAYPEKPVKEVLSGLLPAKLSEGLSKVNIKELFPERSRENSPFLTPYAALSFSEKERILLRVKAYPVLVTVEEEFEKCQVCLGGVSLQNLLLPDFSVKGHEKLVLCGEALNVNGDCGGYNLQWAFTTGILAGRRI